MYLVLSFGVALGLVANLVAVGALAIIKYVETTKND